MNLVDLGKESPQNQSQHVTTAPVHETDLPQKKRRTRLISYDKIKRRTTTISNSSRGGGGTIMKKRLLKNRRRTLSANDGDGESITRSTKGYSVQGSINRIAPSPIIRNRNTPSAMVEKSPYKQRSIWLRPTLGNRGSKLFQSPLIEVIKRSVSTDSQAVPSIDAASFLSKDDALRRKPKPKTYSDFTLPPARETTYQASDKRRGRSHRVTDLQKQLPDELLHVSDSMFMNPPNGIEFEAVTMMIDLSDFTRISSDYQSTYTSRKKGADRFSSVIAGHFSKVVRFLVWYGADVYKFGGDAIVCGWKKGRSMKSLEKLLPYVLGVAIDLKKIYGTLETEIGTSVVSQFKIGIAYGYVRITVIGNDSFLHWIMLGQAIRNSSVAESLCGPGDIILVHQNEIPPAIFELFEVQRCQPNSFRILKYKQPVGIRQTMFNEIFNIHSYRTHPIKPFPTSRYIKLNVAPAKDQLPELRFSSVAEVLKPSADDGSEPEEVGQDFHHKRSEKTSHFVRRKADSGNNNPLFNSHRFLTQEEKLSKFIPKTVLRKTLRSLALSSYGEMRDITIVFIHPHINGKNLSDCTIKGDILCSKIFNKIYYFCEYSGRNDKYSRGSLLKATMFDKGLCFMCAFGLPGQVYGQSAENGLRFARDIHTGLMELEHVDKVSIGVSTGWTFCGVMGDKSLRCEYTVIGNRVNYAVRLMTSYEGIIACDNVTKRRSRGHSSYFELLPSVALKGISSNEPCWLCKNVDWKRRSSISVGQSQTDFGALMEKLDNLPEDARLYLMIASVFCERVDDDMMFSIDKVNQIVSSELYEASGHYYNAQSHVPDGRVIAIFQDLKSLGFINTRAMAFNVATIDRNIYRLAKLSVRMDEEKRWRGSSRLGESVVSEFRDSELTVANTNSVMFRGRSTVARWTKTFNSEDLKKIYSQPVRTRSVIHKRAVIPSPLSFGNNNISSRNSSGNNSIWSGFPIRVRDHATWTRDPETGTYICLIKPTVPLRKPNGPRTIPHKVMYIH